MMQDWGWIVVSTAAFIAGIGLGSLLTWISMVDCRREQWQLRDELQRTRNDLLRIEDLLGRLTSKDGESPKILDRSDGRPGPKHRTMWGDV